MVVPAAVKSPDALRDFNRLYAWIASGSGDAQAEVVLKRIDEVTLLLARRPRLGRRRMDFKGEPHCFSVPPWLIVYEPIPEGNGIYILRILDSRQHVSALLGKKT